MTLGTLCIALQPSFPVLLVARALQGFGSGGLFPIAAAVIGVQVPAERQGRMLGLLGATFGIAFLLGPPAAGVLQSFAHWTWIFWIQLPLLLACLAAATSTIPSHKRSGAQLDWIFRVCFAFSGGLALVALGLSRLTSSNPWFGLLEPLTAICIDSSVLLSLIGTGNLGNPDCGAFHSSRPLSPARLLRRAFLLALAAGLGEMGVASAA
jgi:MFS family permease